MDSLLDGYDTILEGFKEREMKEQTYQAVWRRKATGTYGFPKLMVHDDIVSGSINIRGTRLPLWAIISTAINEGWEAVEHGWSPEKSYGYTKEDLAHFLYCLLEQRGEFGRLLLLLARVERQEWHLTWWKTKKTRDRVIRQLQRCIDALKQIDREETIK